MKDCDDGSDETECEYLYIIEHMLESSWRYLVGMYTPPHTHVSCLSLCTVENSKKKKMQENNDALVFRVKSTQH